MPTSPRRGFSLIESAVVLGVVGIVIGGIWVAASAVRERLKINRLVEATLQVTTNMTRLWGGRMDQSSITYENITAEMLRAGVFPGGFKQNDDPSNGCWVSGPSAVSPDDGKTNICISPNVGGYDLTFSHMSIPICVGLVNRLQFSKNIIVIEIADYFTHVPTNPTDYKLPVTLPIIKEQCETMNGDVRISFSIR